MKLSYSFRHLRAGVEAIAELWWLEIICLGVRESISMRGLFCVVSLLDVGGKNVGFFRASC